MTTNTYWNKNGKYQNAVDVLNKLIPTEGPVSSLLKNPHLEKFRKASNCYYDLYNNDLNNRAREFASVFGIRSSDHRHNGKNIHFKFGEVLFHLVEVEMDKLVLAAANEQFMNSNEKDNYRLAMCKINETCFVSPIEKSRIKSFESGITFLFWIDDFKFDYSKI